MEIETDEEFTAQMRERFAAKPYSHGPIVPGQPEYWTDERYEAFIAKLLKTQQKIRAAATEPPFTGDGQTPEEVDLAQAKWAIWFIQSRDCGATPTHWHRVWEAIRSVIRSTRHHERGRIGRALRADNVQALGPTAAALIEQAGDES